MKKTAAGPSALKSLTARDLMSEAVLSLTENSVLEDALHLFIENHVGAAPVLDGNGKAVGVITKTDLARFDAARRGLSLSEARPPGKKGAHRNELVGTWMTPFVLSVDPDASLAEIAKLMVKNGVHHIFVSRDKKLIGVISGFDVLRVVSRALNAVKKGA